MSISRKIIIDELIEQGHPEKVENVIFWALEQYYKNNKGTYASIIAYAIIERIKESEKTKKVNMMSPELIDLLNL